MNDFLKIIAGTLISLIVYIVLTKQNKDYSLLITVAACCMILAVALTYLHPVIQFFTKLKNLGGFDPTITEILLQAVGIGIISEICAMVCTDAGNASMAKAIQLAATLVVIYISLPLFEGMLDIVTGILGEI